MNRFVFFSSFVLVFSALLFAEDLQWDTFLALGDQTCEERDFSMAQKIYEEGLGLVYDQDTSSYQVGLFFVAIARTYELQIATKNLTRKNDSLLAYKACHMYEQGRLILEKYLNYKAKDDQRTRQRYLDAKINQFSCLSRFYYKLSGDEQTKIYWRMVMLFLSSKTYGVEYDLDEYEKIGNIEESKANALSGKK